MYLQHACDFRRCVEANGLSMRLPKRERILDARIIWKPHVAPLPKF